MWCREGDFNTSEGLEFSTPNTNSLIRRIKVVKIDDKVRIIFSTIRRANFDKLKKTIKDSLIEPNLIADTGRIEFSCKASESYSLFEKLLDLFYTVEPTVQEVRSLVDYNFKISLGIWISQNKGERELYKKMTYRNVNEKDLIDYLKIRNIERCIQIVIGTSDLTKYLTIKEKILQHPLHPTYSMLVDDVKKRVIFQHCIPITLDHLLTLIHSITDISKIRAPIRELVSALYMKNLPERFTSSSSRLFSCPSRSQNLNNMAKEIKRYVSNNNV